AAVREHGVAPPAPGRAVRAEGRWWCPIIPERLLVLDFAPGHRALPSPTRVSSIDLSADYATLLVLGPHADRLLVDTGHATGPVPVGAIRTRVGDPRATVVRVGATRYVVQVPTARAGDLWRCLMTAGRPLHAAAVGRDAQRLLAVADARETR
ncbi:MAG: hypothetical protein AB7G37_17665, partial [Solirubrobacteraceae bacterium]